MYRSLTDAVVFSGSIPGTEYDWTNMRSVIGLAASGNGNIPAFIASNPGNVPGCGYHHSNSGLFQRRDHLFWGCREFTITVYPMESVDIGNDLVICQNQISANLSASLSGGATGGTWSGGLGIFSAPNSLVTTYTPDPSGIWATVEIVFVTNNLL
ncbi:MAG: hypothetical protein R2792_00625 [Saprospiraceae bacterium]